MTKTVLLFRAQRVGGWCEPADEKQISPITSELKMQTLSECELLVFSDQPRRYGGAG